MTIPAPLARLRAWCVALAWCVGVAACTPPQRIYSVDPVGPEGQALALDQAVQLVFEDQHTRTIEPGETLRLHDGRFVIEGVRGGDDTTGAEEWDAAQVAGLELASEDGGRRWVDVKTPDDLRDFRSLPRVEQLTLRDGRVIRIGDDDREARWSADGLALRIGAPGADLEDYETVSLAEVRSVILHEPSLVDATITSPMFWVASAAAAGLFILVVDGADENDAVR